MSEISEWGQRSALDPDELVDLMADLHPARPGASVLSPDHRPLHEPEVGLLDEEVLPLFDDWLRGPGVQPCG